MKKFAFGMIATMFVVWMAQALPESLASPGASAAQTGGAKSAKPAQTPDALDRLLAPVALYPDQLLAQMLLCSGNPGKVSALHEWLAANPGLKGSAAQDAAVKSGFEASFTALVLFPQVVTYMAEQLDWTTRVGEAFMADRNAVFASIQRLRAQAQKVGTLKDTPQQQVETKTTQSGQEVIVIEPSNPQVVYVPQYNAQTVYTQPSTSSTTVVVQQDNNDADAAVAGMIGFTAGIAIGAAFDNDYYYGPYGMYGGGGYMYNDAWDDYYDHREDAREDWADHREDLADERTERAGDAREQRTERQENRLENRPETQAQLDQRRSEAQSRASAAGNSQEARGYSQQRAQSRSGTSSDAFSGYSSGRSERSASSRGQSSRSSSSRSRGGGRRR